MGQNVDKQKSSTLRSKSITWSWKETETILHRQKHKKWAKGSLVIKPKTDIRDEIQQTKRSNEHNMCLKRRRIKKIPNNNKRSLKIKNRIKRVKKNVRLNKGEIQSCDRVTGSCEINDNQDEYHLIYIHLYITHEWW